MVSEPTSKTMFWSRTFWLNFFVTLVSILLFLSTEEWFAAHQSWVAGVGTLVGIMGIILRKLTTLPIGVGE